MSFSVNSTLAWVILVVAGILEVVWALSMKASDGFTKGFYTAVTLAAAWFSFWLLSVSLKALPVGTAYTVWTGIGAVGAAVLGILVFHEPAGISRIVCIALIVLGILGLNLIATN